jgi:membrane protease YdiL (CAAX protease family)
LAAVALVARRDGLRGAQRFVRRAMAVRGRAQFRWLAASAIMPLAVYVAAWGLQRAQGLPIPPPTFAWASALGLTGLFLISAAFEELGWTAFALARLEPSTGPIPAAIIIGAAWAIWHFAPLAQAHRTVGWIGAWTVGTIAARVVMSELYVRSGRCAVTAILFHAAVDVGWQLYPVRGSAYDPALTGVVMAVLAVIVAFGGPGRVLAR